ncbi:MAG: hypothetical protein WD963_02540 [Candidatus Paceibacterota bacterium]
MWITLFAGGIKRGYNNSIIKYYKFNKIYMAKSIEECRREIQHWTSELDKAQRELKWWTDELGTAIREESERTKNK